MSAPIRKSTRTRTMTAKAKVIGSIDKRMSTNNPIAEAPTPVAPITKKNKFQLSNIITDEIITPIRPTTPPSTTLSSKRRRSSEVDSDDEDIFSPEHCMSYSSSDEEMVQEYSFKPSQLRKFRNRHQPLESLSSELSESMANLDMKNFIDLAMSNEKDSIFGLDTEPVVPQEPLGEDVSIPAAQSPVDEEFLIPEVQDEMERVMNTINCASDSVEDFIINAQEDTTCMLPSESTFDDGFYKFKKLSYRSVGGGSFNLVGSAMEPQQGSRILSRRSLKKQKIMKKGANAPADQMMVSTGFGIGEYMLF